MSETQNFCPSGEAAMLQGNAEHIVEALCYMHFTSYQCASRFQRPFANPVQFRADLFAQLLTVWLRHAS